MLSPDHGFASRVDRSDFFILVLFWWKSVSFLGPYRILTLAWSEKEPPSATIVIIDSDKVLVNRRNEGIQFNWGTPNIRVIEKCLYLNLCFEIYPYYVYILFTWESKCSRGCCFYVIKFFDIFLLFSQIFLQSSRC